MFAKIAAILAATLEALGKGLQWSLDLAWATARLPAELFSTRPPRPHFEPTVEKSDVLEEYQHARASQAAIHSLNRDGIETLLEYCRAHRDDRASMKLPKDMPPTVLASLIGMDDTALKNLSRAGVGQVRKFMSGKPHGIAGVPSVSSADDVVSGAAVVPETEMTEHERMLWKIRARLLKDKQEPFRAPMPR